MLSDSKQQYPIKVIQFGEGNFLRAFVDWMIQKMNDNHLFQGQVAVVQPIEIGLSEVFLSQNCSYTHYLKGMKNNAPYVEHYINHSIQTIINPYENFNAFLDLAAIESASIIVSNTTEAGIEFKNTDKFENNANVSYPAKLTRLLYKRFKLTNGDSEKGFIILPCELIDYNADHLKKAVLSYIELWSLPKDFKQWLLTANQFCNTLVDRIVPGFPKDTIEDIWKELSYKDQLVVESELFNLWVIEGDDKIREAFPASKVGCNMLVVDDVTPYKTRKVRILNGSHTSLVPIAYLYGLETVRESIEDPVIQKFLYRTLFNEIIPTLTLSKESLERFALEVIERFKNPFIKHYLISISLNSLSKYRTRVLPSLVAYLDNYNQLPKGLTAALAALVVFYRGTYNGKNIPLNDNPDILNLFESLWSKYDGTKDSLHTLVSDVLAYENNWEGNLNHIPGLTDLVTEYSDLLLKQDMKSLIERTNEVL